MVSCTGAEGARVEEDVVVDAWPAAGVNRRDIRF